jgi:transposase
MGMPFLPHRPVVEGIVFRLRTGIPWRDLPREFGAWQTVHRRHQKWSTDGTWDRVLAQLQAAADASGGIDWRCSVDSATARVHQHGATAGRCASGPSSHTGARSNYKDRRSERDKTDEPADHAIGRSRGGLTTKTHALVDGLGRALALIVSPGQAGDSPVLPMLLAELRSGLLLRARLPMWKQCTNDKGQACQQAERRDEAETADDE